MGAKRNKEAFGSALAKMLGKDDPAYGGLDLPSAEKDRELKIKAADAERQRLARDRTRSVLSKSPSSYAARAVSAARSALG